MYNLDKTNRRDIFRKENRGENVIRRHPRYDFSDLSSRSDIQQNNLNEGELFTHLFRSSCVRNNACEFPISTNNF